MSIQIKVTPERFEEVVSIDDEMHLGELTRLEVYEYMCQFVSDGNGGYVATDAARKLFKKIPAKELSAYITQFFKAVSDAYVNPPNGAESGEQ